LDGKPQTETEWFLRETKGRHSQGKEKAPISDLAVGESPMPMVAGEIDEGPPGQSHLDDDDSVLA
jgi:hypothetical protein